MMNRIIIILFMLFVCTNMNAQLVAKMEMKVPIEGVCDKNEVYSLFPMLDSNQKEAVPSSDIVEIIKELNSLPFLKEKPKYKGKCTVKLIVNCKGELIFTGMSVSTKNDDFDNQVMSVYKSISKWQPASLNGKNVDNVQLISYKIKKGVFHKE